MVSFHELERWSDAPLNSAASEASGLAKRDKDVGDQILDINNADLSGEFVEAEMRRRRALADDASDVRRTRKRRPISSSLPRRCPSSSSKRSRFPPSFTQQEEFSHPTAKFAILTPIVRSASTNS